MPIDPTIAAGVKPIELQNPLDQYARVLQIQGAQQNNALGKYQVDEADRALKYRNALSTGYQQATDPKTGVTDYNKLVSSLAAQGFGSEIPDIQKQQLANQKLLDEHEKLQSGLLKDKADISKIESDVLGQHMSMSRDRLAGVTTPQQFIQWHQQNHADPVLSKYFASIGVTPQQSVGRIQASIKNGTFPQLLRESKLGIEKAMQQHFATLDSGGKIELVSTPEYGTGPVKVLKSQKVTASPKNPGTKVTVVNIPQKVESKYGETFGTEMAKSDLSLHDTAVKAKDQAARADRILDLLQNPKSPVITGSGADFRLNLARGLNLVGGNDAELIANTEVLAADLASNTLGAIKASGLGSGQGFTDKDREFLEKAVGGKITLNRQSLIRLSTLARNAAEKSATAWNNRASRIPRSAVQGTGFDTSPVSIPKRQSPSGGPKKGVPTSIPQDAIRELRRNPKTAAYFDEVFGKGAAARVLRGGR